ncbi:MAG: hypothetical protein HYW65_01865 [Candidatus Liptonbacteria bacterium]|nr:hypothetical protein [Candidatus Liptonbacteria bacterium]
MEPEPKISVVEAIWIGTVFALIDIAEVAIVFFGLDDFWILDALASTIFVYLVLKTIPPFRQLITWIGELFPYVGALPLLTAGWLWTTWADWHPEGLGAKTLAVAETAASAAKGGGGGKGAAEGGGGGTAGAPAQAPQARAAEQAPAGAGTTAESAPASAAPGGAPGAQPVPDEALGVQKEPMEKVRELMEKPLPPEEPVSSTEPPAPPPPKLEDVRRREML